MYTTVVSNRAEAMVWKKEPSLFFKGLAFSVCKDAKQRNGDFKG